MTEIRHGETLPVGGPNVDIYSGVEYFELLPQRIAAVQDAGRIAMMNMAFLPEEPITRGIFKGLGAAADRGAEVVLGIDAFALLDQGAYGPVTSPLRISRSRRVVNEQYRMLDELSKHPNARSGIINRLQFPFGNIFAGRSHFKTDVINDYLCLGGVCLQDCHRIDLMAGLEHAETADRLYELMKAITEIGSTRQVLGNTDQIWDIDELTRIYIDAGIPGQSVTQDEAIALIDETEDWLFFSCQFLPTGRIADHLEGAMKKDIDVCVAFNNPAKHDRLHTVHRYIRVKEKLHRPPSFFEHELPAHLPPLHAKALANEKRGMVSGHNFLDLGVKFGTAEITLERRTPEFAHEIRRVLFREFGYPLELH